MFRLAMFARNLALMAIIPSLCAAVAIIGSPTPSQGFGRTLATSEMSRTYGGADFIDKCLKDVPGCSDQDHYLIFSAVCANEFNDPAGCAATPAAFYNYDYVNVKGCEKPKVPATGGLTCVQSDLDVVCSYTGFCRYTLFDEWGITFGVCAPDIGTPTFWAPMFAFELVYPCDGA